MFPLPRQVALLLLASAYSGGALPSVGPAQSLAPDFAELATATLDLDQAASTIEDQTRRERPSLNLYVGSAAGRLWAGSVSVQIDDANPVTYEYSDREAACLGSNGLRHLLETGVKPGTHRLRAEITAYDPTQTQAGSPRTRVRLEKVLSIEAVATQYQLQLLQSTYLSDASLDLRPLQAEAGGEDPHLRDARCLIAGGHYFAAASELRSLQASAEAQHLLAVTVSALRRSGTGAGSESDGAVPTTPPLDPASYDRAVNAIGHGSVTEGVALLEQIGAAKGSDPDALDLRDQANLQLGYALLRQSRNDAALSAFQRIRTPGRFANAALLGLGWASLALVSASSADTTAAGSLRVPLNPEATDNIDRLRRRTPFPSMHTIAIHGQIKALNRALTPWAELIGRDPLDPAVEEGMLAISYALDHLGAHQEAEGRYRSAMDMLEGARATLDLAATHVRDGGLLESILNENRRADRGWPAWVADLPHVHWWLSDHEVDPSSAFYLQYLLADDQFSGLLQSYTDLATLADSLQVHRQRLCGSPAEPVDAGALCSRMGVLQGQVNDRGASVGRQLQDAALKLLQERKDRAGQYMVEADLALARIYDREPVAGGKE